MKIRISYPNDNKMAIIDLPNFEYLPLFYLFPHELLETECPDLMNMPRSVHGIFKQKEWYNKLSCDYFLQSICDLTAYYVWPAFGISTYMECFSGHDPIWLLAHALPIWQKAFEHMSGITPQGFANVPKKEQGWIDLDEFQNVMLQIGLYGITENNLLPCIKAAREMRCFEDYDSRNSNAKIDFYRRWYHTRSKIVSVSTDRITENDSWEDSITQHEDAVCSKIDAEKFYQSLKPLDHKLLQLRTDGYTYQEIAEKTGYNTHSAVLKRINKIAAEYLEYTDTEEVK